MLTKPNGPARANPRLRLQSRPSEFVFHGCFRSTAMTFVRSSCRLLIPGIVLTAGAVAQNTPVSADDASFARQAATRPRMLIVGLTAAPELDSRDSWMTTAIEETLTWRLRRVPGLI